MPIDAGCAAGAVVTRVVPAELDVPAGAAVAVAVVAAKTPHCRVVAAGGEVDPNNVRTLGLVDGVNATSTQKFIPEPFTFGKCAGGVVDPVAARRAVGQRLQRAVRDPAVVKNRW